MQSETNASSPMTSDLGGNHASEAATIESRPHLASDPRAERALHLAGLLDLGLSAEWDDGDNGHYARWTPSAGSHVGRYELVRQLGEGGFGIVWLAVQRYDIQREVALKLIKPGMDSRQVTARFEAERQALAVMDHPNIAQVLDAGTTPDANPFFVMELVRGVPITEFCDIRQMTLRERLQLFVQVCHGVQHAHQKAILHRDLKPSNILVEEVDGEPVPKIIDFGIAKALGGSARAAARGGSTLTGRWAVVGTVQYMSPEQASNESDVDACSDIYSLGTILFELLTGTTPISQDSLADLPLGEILGRIRDNDAPKPSSLFLSGTPSEAGMKAAACRRSEPRKLGLELRGDLDWMVLTALEKDRHRRYESAAAFAQDIRRHLQHEPVLARPPTTSYVLGRLIRRNQAAFISAALVTLALLTACGVAMWSYVKQNQAIKQTLAAEQLAARERTKGQQVSAFLGDMIQDISLGDDEGSDSQEKQTLDPAALRDLLRTAEERRAAQLSDNPEADLRVSLMLAEAHMQQGRPDIAARLYRHALDRLGALGQNGSLEAAECMRSLARCLHRHREETGLSLPGENGLALIDQCTPIFERHLPQAQEQLWEAGALRIGFLRDEGDSAGAAALLSRLFEGPEGELLAASRASGWFLRERAILRGEKGEIDPALDDLDHAVRLLKGRGDARKQSPERLLAADASRIRTAIFLRAGDFENALKSSTEEQAARRVLLGHDDPYAAIRLADVLIRQKKIEAAVAALKAALAVSESIGSLPAQEACLSKLLDAIPAAEPPAFSREHLNARTRLAGVMLRQADEHAASTGSTDESRLLDAFHLLEGNPTGEAASAPDAAIFHAVRAEVAVRRRDFAGAIRDLKRADSLDSRSPAHRAASAVFALASGDDALFELERTELLRRLQDDVPGEDLFLLCCAVLLRPAAQPAQLAQVRARLESYTGDELDSERQEFINGLLEFREGPAQWETARIWLDALRRSSEHPEIATASRLVMAMGLHRAGDPQAGPELDNGIRSCEAFLSQTAASGFSPGSPIVWFVRLLMREAQDMALTTR